MRNLLSAHFSRLRKSKLFLFTMLGFFCLGFYLLYANFSGINGISKTIEVVFFMFLIPLALLLAVFCTLFFGADYSDGTLRNKIIAGHSRLSIYCSNLLVAVLAGLCMSAAFLLPICCLGFSISCGFVMPRNDLIWYFINTVLTICAFAALFTMISMLCTRKASAVTICLLGTIALFVLSGILSSALSTPEFYEEFDSFDPITGETIFRQVPAYGYISGIKRVVYSFLLNIQPMGQAYQLAMCSAEQLSTMAIYSSCFTVTVTGVGLLCFRKKNLK